MDCAELRSFIRQLNRRSLGHMLSITDMVTMGSEFRLGKTLLRLAARLGTTHPAGTLISCRISQEELSHMVGTTRPRITEFMSRFRALGLVRISTARRLIIKEPALLSHLASLG
jgi:CRP-like cAMP-binding protein